MLGCLVMVSSATAKAVFEEWGGGLRSGAFAGRPASHRQAVRVEEEIVDAHREDAVFVADGLTTSRTRTIFWKLSSISSSEAFSCATFSGVGSWYAD